MHFIPSSLKTHVDNSVAKHPSNRSNINAFHAAGECTVHTTGQKINHEKCIQISTNMPGIGSENREIAVKISEMSESKHDIAQ